MSRGGRGERGAVTAELALGLPLLVAVTVALAWVLALGVTQVRLVDAAREAARVAARGESSGEAERLAWQVAPRGSTVRIHHSGETVSVVVRATVDGPAGILGVPGVTLSAEAVAAVEPTG